MNKFYMLLLTLFLVTTIMVGQVEDRQPFPFEFTNNTDYPDDKVFVAIMGEDFSGTVGGGNHKHIWVDLKTGIQYPMEKSYNTVPGPVYVMVYDDPGSSSSYTVMPARNDVEGNRNPDGTALYADIFTPLSEIPNKTVMLEPIQGCRVYISVEEQLYMFFHGPGPGGTKGYTAPAPTDPTDPNRGILHEVIELTYDKWGYFANTTRVDSYKFPIAMEVWGIVEDEEVYKKVGEIQSHEYIVNEWKEYVKEYPEFTNCLNEFGEITQPTKIADFADGTVGTMPDIGPHVDYMQPYIDQIWEKYRNEDLHFYTGDAGYFKGRVNGDVLTVTSQSEEGGPFYGRSGTINGKPNTQEVLEGKGLLDNVVDDRVVDLMIQAQICAAITRHVVDVKTPNVGLQYWNDPTQYYLEEPANMYSKFWHREDISAGGRSYGFAYDDVWDQSSSAPVHHPHRVVVTMGGFYGILESVVCKLPNSITLNYPSETTAILDGSESYSSEGSALTYEWNIAGNSNGVILTNDNKAIANASFTELGKYVFTLKVSNGTDYSTCQIVVDVVDENASAPFVSAGPDKSVVLPDNTVTLTGDAVDLDGQIVTYKWSQVDGPSQATLSGDATTTLTASNLKQGAYVFKLTATDNDGLTGDDTVNVYVIGGGVCTGESSNGDYTYIFSGDDTNPTLTFVPSRPGVGDNTVILYLNGQGITVGANNPHTINANSGTAITFYYTYSIPEGGENNTAASPHSETVGSCGTSNQYPSVNAGENVYIDLATDNNSVTLNGTGNDPEDGNNVTFKWIQLSGPNSATLSGDNSKTVTASNLVEGVYKFELSVTDTQSAKMSDAVYVFVSDSDKSSVSVENIEKGLNNLSIYPNPVNDILYINLDKTRLLNKALVINANGTVLITRDILTDESFSVDMSGLSQGVYLLQLQGDGFVEVHKIIKK